MRACVGSGSINDEQLSRERDQRRQATNNGSFVCGWIAGDDLWTAGGVQRGSGLLERGIC